MPGLLDYPGPTSHSRIIATGRIAFLVDFTGSGIPYDMISITQVDANTFTDEQKKAGGMYHTTGRTVISKDGKTMIVTRSGTSADGSPFTATYVFEKQ